MSDALTKKFQDKLKQSLLVSPGETIYIACSGGPDSTALFHLFASIQKEWKLRLGLLHFNHNLRPKPALKDEIFVKKLAKKFKIPFISGRGWVKQLAAREKFSTEEAARKARYDFFLKTAEKRKGLKIATAHTLDDQAETILMRILQGTGLRGLCGIRRSFKMGKACFVRPLLDFSKAELLGYLRGNQIAFCLDLSNASEKHLRNRIRLKLIPQLMKEFHPKIKETLARVPAILNQDAELLDALENDLWKKVFTAQKKGEIVLSRKKFLAAAPSMQFRLLDRGLRSLDPKSGLSFEAWQTVRTGLLLPQFRHSLPKDIDLILTPLKLRVYKK